MRDPGAVVAVGGFALLVGADLRERSLVRFGIRLDGDEGGHAAHGVDAAAMAGLDAELGIAAHEVRGHGDLRTVGEEDGGVGGELFDEGEDVVPAAAVEAGGVLAELEEDLVHLEGGEDGFDQHSGTDGAAGDVEEILRAEEDVVPEAGFEVRLELGQVEVGAGAAASELARVVEEVEAEVEEGAGDEFADRRRGGVLRGASRAGGRRARRGFR